MLAVSVLLCPMVQGQSGSTRVGNSATAAANNDKGSPITIANRIENQWVYTATANGKNEPANGNESSQWALVFVGVITCGVVSWQSWETRKSAAATALAAQASQRSVDTLINSERAWVIIRPHAPDLTPISAGSLPPYGLFYCELINKGKTVAKLLSLDAESRVIDSGQTLPEIPTYPEMPVSDLGFVHGSVVAPGDSIDGMFIRINHFYDIDRLRRGDSRLYIYGRLGYFDFTKTPRTLQFCYRYMAAGISPVESCWSSDGEEILKMGQHGGDAAWVIHGPANYNTST